VEVVPLHALHTIALHAAYLSLLPHIEQHGQIYFRYLRCPHKKADAIQEMRSLAWKWLVRLHKKGKDANDFPVTFVNLLARAVSSGRRIAGMEKAKDVLNAATQKRKGFKVEALDSSTCTSHERLYAEPLGQQLQDAFEERLRDNTLTPVPEQVAFRIDFPAWLQSLTARERRIIHAMTQNERTKDISRQFDLSPGRISQMRRELHQDWTRFCDGLVASD
jgi:hypothetical protein